MSKLKGCCIAKPASNAGALSNRLGGAVAVAVVALMELNVGFGAAGLLTPVILPLSVADPTTADDAVLVVGSTMLAAMLRTSIGVVRAKCWNKIWDTESAATRLGPGK